MREGSGDVFNCQTVRAAFQSVCLGSHRGSLRPALCVHGCLRADRAEIASPRLLESWGAMRRGPGPSCAQPSPLRAGARILCSCRVGSVRGPLCRCLSGRPLPSHKAAELTACRRQHSGLRQPELPVCTGLGAATPSVVPPRNPSQAPRYQRQRACSPVPWQRLFRHPRPGQSVLLPGRCPSISSSSR